MKTLLRLDSSPRAERSHSKQLTASYARIWQEAHPEGKVVHRDLSTTPPPFVTEAWIAAAYCKPAERTPEMRAALAFSDMLIDELLAADALVIGAPMYNFSVPASLKAWIDQVARIGRTIELPSLRGLVADKPTTIITVRGGAGYGPGEAMAHLDFEVPYLKTGLGFLGLLSVSVVYVGHLSGGDELRRSSLEKARAEIEQLAAR